MTAFLLAIVSDAERGMFWPDSWFGRCWVLFGLGAQLMFGSRFIVQWIMSERRKRSHIPIAFWYLSIIGAVMLLSYAFAWKRDPVLCIGQSCGLFVYLRNIALLRREKREMAAVAEQRKET
jgi:lipid-A-disaccharide synthase-like uncharacterized protein